MTIWILIIGTMALSLFAAARVKSIYSRYNRGAVLSGVTSGEVAALILRQAGVRDMEIAVQDQMLGDHYDPIDKWLVPQLNPGGPGRGGLRDLAGLLPVASAAAAQRTGSRVHNLIRKTQPTVQR